MKKYYAIADVVPKNSRIVAGKRYEIIVIGKTPHSGVIFAIPELLIVASIEKGCAHLNGGNWRIVDEEDVSDAQIDSLLKSLGFSWHEDASILARIARENVRNWLGSLEKAK